MALNIEKAKGRDKPLPFVLEPKLRARKNACCWKTIYPYAPMSVPNPASAPWRFEYLFR